MATLFDDLNSVLQQYGVTCMASEETLIVTHRTVTDIFHPDKVISRAVIDKIWPTVRNAETYQQAMDNLQVILGEDKFSVNTAEQINSQMGSAAGTYLGDLPNPSPESEAQLLVATADCKGVPLVKEDAAKLTAFETAKKNPGNRRMATVASVYTVDPHVRTAEEIIVALFRDAGEQAQDKPKRPEPANKNTTSHLPETADDGKG